MVAEKIEGIITRCSIHDQTRKYGLQINDDPRWFNGFELPVDICEGCVVELYYYTKVVGDKTFYNVTAIVPHHPPSKDNNFICPRCQLRLEVTPADTQ